MKGLSLKEIGLILNSPIDSDLSVTGYQIDSRLIAQGNLFFALWGEKGREHDEERLIHHVQDALWRGAIAAVVPADCLIDIEGALLFRVDDVLKTLHHLAHSCMRDVSIPLIGVTGSVGKTTTKDFLATLLEGRYRVGKSPASYNSQNTYPINLLNRVGDEQVLVMEFGMSERGEMRRLVQIASPDIALLTNVVLAHAQNFPEGLSAIAAAKGEIFSEEKTKTAILDWDCLQYEEMVRSIRGTIVTFSMSNPAADYFLSYSEGKYRIDERGIRAFECELPFKESHLLHDFVAAIAAARQIAMQWEEIERQISRLHLPKMRFEQFEMGGVWFINDAYNANPSSMRAALENLPKPKEGGKTIAVLGAMKELGTFSITAHQEMGIIAQKYVDYLLCFDEESEPLCETYRTSMKPAELFFDHNSMADRLREIIRPGDVVLIKGSRSMQMEKLLEMIHVTSPC